MSIKLDNVSYSYGRASAHNTPVINSVSLEIAQGELVGIMGKSGSGRSTLLQLMAGVLCPSEGHVLVDGEDINSKMNRDARLLQKPALVLEKAERQLFERTVEREVGVILRGSDMPAEEKQSYVRQALESIGFDFEAVCSKSPLAFSASERYKIAVAAVLAASPECLLLDEPTAQLDSAGRIALLNLIRTMRDEGRTVVIATNDADFLAEHFPRVIVLEQGRIIRDCAAKGLFTDYYYLIRNHLAVPQVKSVAQKLRQRDVNMPSNIMEYEQFIDRLKIIMWRKSR